jgi:hypothetical protein
MYLALVELKLGFVPSNGVGISVIKQFNKYYYQTTFNSIYVDQQLLLFPKVLTSFDNTKKNLQIFSLSDVPTGFQFQKFYRRIQFIFQLHYTFLAQHHRPQSRVRSTTTNDTNLKITIRSLNVQATS